MDIQRLRNAPPIQVQTPFVATAASKPTGPVDGVELESQPLESGQIRPLRILHLNDLHGAVEPEEDAGGLARVATILDRQRAENPEGTLTLNAGDLAEGTMVAYLTKGQVVSEPLGTMGFDAVQPGNHDFAWGQEALQDMLDDLNAPILSANIVHSEDGSPWATPYLLKDLNGVRVGILGLDVQDMARYVSAEKLEGLEFQPPSTAVARYLPEMREQGAEVVVVLSHHGFDEDCKLAREFPGIDVIVGGHSHTVLEQGHREGDTLIVQSGTKGRFVGSVDLGFDLSRRRIVSAEARLIPVGADVPPDPEVQAIINRAVAEVEPIGARVMGVAEEELHYSHGAAAKINQIHADSVLQASGAEIALCSARNPRGNLPQGEVTYKDLFSAYPMTEEDTVVMKVTGRMLMAEMEERIGDGGRGPATPAGFRYTYDPSRPSGQRLTEVVLADGSPMDPDREYTVGTTITMARKKTFREAKEVRNLGSSQEMFMEAFAAGSPWRNDPDNRLVRL
jgi:2',3'-cyclic-nucleotide 2'-phosphodiesterase (5'-nucleotidase family)